jgi:hypothetical protein
LRLFPAWPANESAAFTNLRMRGALLVSAAYVGNASWAGQVAGRAGGTVNVTIAAEVTAAVQVLSPWPQLATSSVVMCDLGVHPSGGAVTGRLQATTATAAASCSSGQPVPLAWSSLPGEFGGPLAAWNATEGHSYVLLPI